jgi:restriction endonuclease Mrr
MSSYRGKESFTSRNKRFILESTFFERCEKLIPNSSSLRLALIEVLREHPSGLSSKEIDKLAAAKLMLTETDLSQIRSGNRTEFAYRMAWERTHAKAKGQIRKLENRFWAISDAGSSL